MVTRRVLGPALAALVAGCATMGLGNSLLSRPPELVAEWIDLKHTAPRDTSLWVLRADGYDGLAHLLAAGDGSPARRTEVRYGAWYFEGALSDPSNRAICFAKRLGRDGATCLSFSLDTVDDHGPRRRLLIHGYRGEHGTGERQLVERRRSDASPF